MNRVLIKTIRILSTIANNKKSASFRDIFLQRSGDTLRALQNFECEADPQHGDKPQQMVSDNHHH